MGWWRVDYNLDGGRKLTGFLHELASLVKSGEGNETFFREVLASAYGVPLFFRQMFEVRSVGGSYYNREWRPISEAYRDWKVKKGYDSRIGIRTGHLQESLTVPGSRFNILEITKKRAIFGSNVTDTEAGEDHGQAYSNKFSEVRPVVDQQEISNIRSFLLEGDGRPAFDSAAGNFKRNLIERARNK